MTGERPGGGKWIIGLVVLVCAAIALALGGYCLGWFGKAADGGKGGESKKGPDDWFDASKGPATEGKVRVEVTGLRIGKIGVSTSGEKSTSKKEMLAISVKIMNLHESKKLKYTRWAKAWPDANSGLATLIDDTRKRYMMANFGAAVKIDGQVAADTFIEPGKSITEALVFEQPPAAASELQLRLPLNTLGETGRIRIKIPVSMVKKE